MQWSKLKTKVKDLICPELNDRVDFFVTSYRESHDGADRVWITVDGQTVLECKHHTHESAEANAYHSGLPKELLRIALRDKEVN